jgi:3'-phosphoadenosine 5'-phosphosulfate sulfotransferase (PAPS reductase)/FAD synthetase
MTRKTKPFTLAEPTAEPVNPRSKPVAMTTLTGIRVQIPVMIAERISAGADLVVSLSGGKDSTATALYLEEIGAFDAVVAHGGEVRRVFADTGWELPETYAYLPTLEGRFGKIDRVALHVPIRGEEPPPGYAHLEPVWKSSRGGDGGFMHGDSAAYARIIEARLGFYSPLIRLILEWRKMPDLYRRWCTEETKSRPIKGYLVTCPNPVNAIGVRAEESITRAAMPAAEWSDDYDAFVWRPIHALTKADVIDLHLRHGMSPNPLYLQGHGAGRIGCAPCVYSGRDVVRWMAAHHADRLAILAQLEECVEALSPPRFEKTGVLPLWFHRSEGAKTIPIPVAEAVRLASDDQGGEAPLLFEPARHPGCAEWGLCTT